MEFELGKRAPDYLMQLPGELDRTSALLLCSVCNSSRPFFDMANDFLSEVHRGYRHPFLYGVHYLGGVGGGHPATLVF